MQKILHSSIYLLKTRAWIILFLVTAIACQNPQHKPSKITGKQLPVTDSIKVDKTIDSFIKPFRNKVNETMDEVLAYNKNYTVKTDGQLNSSIGNMMADIVMEQANPIFESRTGKQIDMVLLNYGGIRAPMQKGNITRRTAFEIMPFENEIVVVELSQEGIEGMKHYLENAKAAHPVAGVEIEMNQNYHIQTFKIKQQIIDTSQTYFVATSDYLKNGGDQMYFFEDALSVTELDYKIRNAIIDYFEKVDTIAYTTDRRFILKE